MSQRLSGTKPKCRRGIDIAAQNVAAAFWRQTKMSQPCFTAYSKCRRGFSRHNQNVAEAFKSRQKMSQPCCGTISKCRSHILRQIQNVAADSRHQFQSVAAIIDRSLQSVAAMPAWRAQSVAALLPCRPVRPRRLSRRLASIKPRPVKAAAMVQCRRGLTLCRRHRPALPATCHSAAGSRHR